MNERLEKLIKAENLTSAKFAEILSVQPSSISHLLSGRNKPNFDFISNLLTMFPAVNPRWFINGEGEMYIAQNSSEIPPANPQENTENYTRELPAISPKEDTLGNPYSGMGVSELNAVTNVTAEPDLFDQRSATFPNTSQLGGIQTRTPQTTIEPIARPTAEPQSFVAAESAPVSVQNIPSPLTSQESEPAVISQHPVPAPQEPVPAPIEPMPALQPTVVAVVSEQPQPSSDSKPHEPQSPTKKAPEPVADASENQCPSSSLTAQTSDSEPKESQHVKEKKIVKVLFFYDDNTFEVFNS
ncbi:MAG: helix-turn-helix domain-containing protein [Rikenellaceae bacterium]